MLNFSIKKSQSHFLILLCVIISIIWFIFPGLKYQFALHSWVLSSGFFNLISQTLLFQFFHADLLHLLFNCYFLYLIGLDIEARMSKNNFFNFLIFTTICLVISLSFFTSNTLTVWISGFCLALLSYMTIDLYNTKHVQFYNFLILLLINIFIWLSIEFISFIWHFVGAICWIFWWLIFKKFKFFK